MSGNATCQGFAHRVNQALVACNNYLWTIVASTIDAITLTKMPFHHTMSVHNQLVQATRMALRHFGVRFYGVSVQFRGRGCPQLNRAALEGGSNEE
jgi:hypothetical protein